MNSYIPLLTLHPDELAGERVPNKFGGLPDGLPRDHWPSCAECGNPMTFVVRFRHHPDRFPLGREGRVLYIFQCESGTCAAWEPDSGANRVLILEPEQLSGDPPSLPAADVPVLPEAWVTGWLEKEERPDTGAAPESASVWLDFVTSPVASEDAGTKLGGQPDWLQMPEPVEPPYRFAAQIDHVLLLEGEASPLQYQVFENEDFRSVNISSSPPEAGQSGGDEAVQAVEFARFGDGGRGYLFVNPDPERPDGYFLWQSW